MFASQVPDYLDDDLIGTDAHARRRQLRDRASAVPVDRAAGRAHARAPGAARRRPAAPLRRRRARRLRVLAHRPRAAARVRRRAQQRRDGEDGRDPDLHARALLPARLRRRAGDADERRRRPAGADRPAAVGGRLRARRRDPGAPSRRPRWRSSSRRPAAAARGRMEVRADVDGASFYEVTFLAQVRRQRLAADRHRRQRSLPRLPRRLGAAHGNAAAVPRGRARQPRPHALERRARDRGAGADRHDRGAGRGREGARHASRCGRRPTPSARPTSWRSSAASPAARGRRSAATTRRRPTPCSTTLRRWRSPPARRSATARS